MSEPRNVSALGPWFADRVRAIMDDSGHGIFHNGNDHRQGPLANCPRCVAEGLLNELAQLRAVVDAAYIAKHEGRFEPLHNALHALEDRAAVSHGLSGDAE